MTAAEVYERLSPKVLLYARKRAGADAAEDVAAEAWRKFLTLREPVRNIGAMLTTLVQAAAREHHRAAALLAKKRAALTRGEVIRGGSRTCPWCGRPGRTVNGMDAGKDGLCWAHFYRKRRAERLGRVPDMAAPIQATFRERKKLTDAQVAEIRRRLTEGEKGTALAREFGIGCAQVSRIRNGTRRGGTPRRLRRGFRSDLRSGRRMSLAGGGARARRGDGGAAR